MGTIEVCSLSANRGSFLLQPDTISNTEKQTWQKAFPEKQLQQFGFYTDMLSLPRHQITNPGQGPPGAPITDASSLVFPHQGCSVNIIQKKFPFLDTTVGKVALLHALNPNIMNRIRTCAGKPRWISSPTP